MERASRRTQPFDPDARDRIGEQVERLVRLLDRDLRLRRQLDAEPNACSDDGERAGSVYGGTGPLCIGIGKIRCMTFSPGSRSSSYSTTWRILAGSPLRRTFFCLSVRFDCSIARTGSSRNALSRSRCATSSMSQWTIVPL